ncbi:MAG: PAS domain S-box-containing protein [Psychromonas sp.]|jgi:PAS domain S-box-containing protein|uniref:PAS domain S-box protein n=1 Tax=Psychromonas sp. TaxID=1884585 RepID=UPI0039E57278
MSFRLKTILSIAFIESILLITLIISMISFLNESNQIQLQQRASSTTHLIAKSVKNAILTDDLATLESYVVDILNMPEIVYVRISNNQYMLTEGGNLSSLNSSTSSTGFFTVISGGVLATQVKISESNTIYGTVDLGMSTHSISSLFFDIKYWIVAIACFEVALMVIFSYILGNYLTRQLQQLKLATEKITDSGPGVQLPVRGSDEIAEVTKAFNRMSANLAKNYERLTESVDKEKQMSAIAKHSEAKNKAILTASLDALITIDENGKVIDYNKVAAATFGWRYDEIIGQDLAEFIIPPAQRQAHHQGMQKYLKTKLGPVLNQRIQLTAQHKSGHNFPIEINIAPIETEQGTLFTAFIRDISTRLQAESELRLAAQTFESSEAIFICDNQGTIIRSNQAFSRITGYDNHDVIGKNPRILSSGQHSEEYYKTMWLSLTEHGEWSGEIYNKRKNGEIYPEYLNISSVKNDQGEVSHYIAHFFDISEQKENEKKLQQARKEAELSNASKSRFLASMSHEIRTPMNAVLGILGLLKDTQLTARQHELVKTGRDSGELLLTIINDILDFTKMDIDKLTLENSPFDLHQLLTNCNALLVDMANKKSLTLNLKKSQDLPRFVRGDSARIQQILINLINNAIKFSQHGQIKVRVGVDFIDQHNVMLRCQVKDSGIGIAKEYMDTLFDEFTMVDQSHTRKYEGTGLGLAICKRLSELMQGSIAVNSKLGKGSTFTFTLKLKTAKADDGSAGLFHEQIQQLPQANIRVLLVEDNPANQMVIKSILEFAKLRVDVVSNGYEAVEAVRNLPYDIVLMDISMPEMDGMSATREIRKLSSAARKIPIIALTAHTLSGDKERFIKAGMNDYLSKPVNRDAALTCIARWTKGAKPSAQAEPQAEEQHNAENEHSDFVDQQVLLDLVRDTNAENEHPDFVDQQVLRDRLRDTNAENEYPDFVDQQVLLDLVRDTNAEIVPELITLYIEDSQRRIAVITEAITKRDLNCLEFETHTLGSSAIAHGNARLYSLARSIEQLCQQNAHQQAFEQAQLIAEVAEESFRRLAQRAKQGFA